MTNTVNPDVNLETLLHQAGLIFQESIGSGARFSEPVVIKDWARSLVVRCRVQAADSAIASIIIKQIKGDAARGFSDWASLAFLSALPQAQSIVPRFYGGDVAHRVFLMEDMGEAQNLHDLLNGDDSVAAQVALQTLATQMARLHNDTLEKQELFEAVRAALPEAEGLGRQHEATSWLDNRGKLFEWFLAVGYVPSSGFDGCLTHIANVYSQADGFLGFTHGDPAPSNNHFAGGRARLLDFEYGAFRHVLYDITAWNILCPLSEECVRDMSQRFRKELAKSYPAARDEAQFARAWAFLCAYRALAILTWIPPDVIGHNRPWVDNWTMRQAVLAAVSRLVQATASCAELQPVGEAAAALTKVLRSRWPEFENDQDILPQWRALKSP